MFDGEVAIGARAQPLARSRHRLELRVGRHLQIDQHVSRLAKEGVNFAVMAANDTVETKIKRFGFIELEKLRHQFDKAGFHLLPL